LTLYLGARLWQLKCVPSKAGLSRCGSPARNEAKDGTEIFRRTISLVESLTTFVAPHEAARTAQRAILYQSRILRAPGGLIPKKTLSVSPFCGHV
jgi:hypothetical protein